MDETPNHNFNQYQHGERPWGHQEDFEELEEIVPIRDVESNLSNYTPHGGATFIATDTGAVFDGTGEEWIAAKRRFGEIATTGSGGTLWGSSGDHVPLASIPIAQGTQLSTSSTSYVRLTTSATQRPSIHLTRQLDLSNVTNKEIFLTCVLSSGSSNVTAYARLNTYRAGSLPGTRISRQNSAGAIVTGPYAPLDSAAPDRIDIEGRVSSSTGTCTVYSATAHLAGVID